MQEPASSLIRNAALIETLKESCLIGLLESKPGPKPFSIQGFGLTDLNLHLFHRNTEGAIHFSWFKIGLEVGFLKKMIFSSIKDVPFNVLVGMFN